MRQFDVRRDSGTEWQGRATPDFGTDYLQRLSRRDPDTEMHFVRHFAPLLRFRLQRRFRDVTRAEDFVQETLLRVLRTVRDNPNAIEHPERLGAYVHSVCRNVILESYRQQGRLQGFTNATPELLDPRADVEHSLLSAERQSLLRTVLGAMPAKDRVLLTEIFLEEREKDDVCTRHGVERPYLRVLLFRALGRIRVEIEKKSRNVAIQ
jgi:RNA polymerase sigma factor (sigma-70 family)